MKKFILFGLILIFTTAACSSISPQAELVIDEEVRLVRSMPWKVEAAAAIGLIISRKNGFLTETIEFPSLEQIKKEYQVPEEFQACHAAIVNGYVIEGHVPVGEIERYCRKAGK